MKAIWIFYCVPVWCPQQRCSRKKEAGGRLKQDLDKDLQLHTILILLY